jgi:hypothetical protein
LQIQITAKGKEINEFREKHNIRFNGEAPKANEQKEKSDQTQKPSGGVLV